MPFAEILGQDHAIALLQRAIARDKLSSAYLFCGSHHTGKQKTALAFAQRLNCLQSQLDACGQCDYCRQIAHGTFADFSVIEPDGQFIKISQIQGALEWLSLRPAYAKQRILVLAQAECMNKESANAFLKTLEEPPAATLIILLAERPQQLLETIVSRCQIVRFQLLSPEHIQQILSAQASLKPETLSFLARFSLGQVRGDWIERAEALQDLREQVIQRLMRLSESTMPETLKLVEQWSGSKEEEWEPMLDFLEYWFRDLACLLHGLSPERLLNQDKQPELQRCLTRLSRQQILDNYQQVLATRAHIASNANKPLALQALWIRFKQSGLSLAA